MSIKDKMLNLFKKNFGNLSNSIAFIEKQFCNGWFYNAFKKTSYVKAGLFVPFFCIVIVSCAGYKKLNLPTDTSALQAVHTIFIGDFGNIEVQILFERKYAFCY